MGTMRLGSEVLLLWSAAFVLLGSCSGKFSDDFHIPWGPANVVMKDDLEEVDLSLTQASGARVTSYGSYLYGAFSVNLKLIPSYSAGTVCSFYLSSEGASHDEIDFEFLGNVTGEPYVLHTNLFTRGVGLRESRMYLWFDPTADFHNYTIIWNHKQIVWYVDDVPVRVYKNIEDVYPDSYLNLKAQTVTGSIFEASTWATRGGLVPIDWQYAPFTADYKNFTVDACKIDDTNSCGDNYEKNWWEAPEHLSMTSANTRKMKDIIHRYRFYDYCSDTVGHPTRPTELASKVKVTTIIKVTQLPLQGRYLYNAEATPVISALDFSCKELVSQEKQVMMHLPTLLLPTIPPGSLGGSDTCPKFWSESVDVGTDAAIRTGTWLLLLSGARTSLQGFGLFLAWTLTSYMHSTSVTPRLQAFKGEDTGFTCD